MLIIDFSQVMIANLMINIFSGKNTDAVQPDFLRHMILNTTRAIRVKFKADQWGELILACDSKDYWRKDIFPFYKANRKKKREESSLDWTIIHQHFDTFIQEINENFPYRVVRVPKCEADDIIGTLCVAFGNASPLNMGEPIKIVSGDEDFKQLQVYGNVSQYDQIRKKEVTSSEPDKELINLILSGDSGDGVPNVLSQDDCFVEGVKQRPLRAERIKECTETPFDQLPADIQRNWKRNMSLVDLHSIPTKYKDLIMEQYKQQAGKSRTKIFPYMMSKRLKLLMEHVGEF